MKKQIALLLPVLHGIFYSRGITIITANLFRWLLQERIVLQNWNAVDFDGGSTLNAVDLTLLKRGRAVPDLENAS